VASLSDIINFTRIFNWFKMKKITITTQISETTDSALELPAADQELIASAYKAAGTSWSPYSNFAVGAAVRLADGTIVAGANIENASFPCGICAEHNALSTAASNYPDIGPVAMAITAVSKGAPLDIPVAPCGKCRQVIAETETRYNRPVRLLLAGKDKIVIVERGSDLLPLMFSQKDLSRVVH
jgi:cytidine deaminase